MTLPELQAVLHTQHTHITWTGLLCLQTHFSPTFAELNFDSFHLCPVENHGGEDMGPRVREETPFTFFVAPATKRPVQIASLNLSWPV